jgi:hypothetical protein
MEIQLQPLKSYEKFIQLYFNGVMKEGLLKPLSSLSANTDFSGQIANSWYELQLQGQSPQMALANPKVALPHPLKRALTVGFEKSVLDLVLQDIIQAFKETPVAYDLEERILRIAEKYHSINTSSICIGCECAEISKILMRAHTENADEVVLQQEGDFLLQSYIGIKLVQVREASIPAVYKDDSKCF